MGQRGPRQGRRFEQLAAASKAEAATRPRAVSLEPPRLVGSVVARACAISLTEHQPETPA